MRNILCVQNKSAHFNERAIPSFNLNTLEIWKLCSIFETIIVKMAIFFTNVDDFQTVLNACLTVRDRKRWKAQIFWTRNNFWGSPAFFENVFRFSKLSGL